MAKELQQFGPTGRTVYATIVVAAGASGGQYFNRNTPGLEAFNSANWTTAKYAVVCADTNGVGLYTADVPTGLAAGQYSVVFYTQSGGSPAVGDQPLGGAALVWDGTTVTTISDKAGYALSAAGIDAIPIEGVNLRQALALDTAMLCGTIAGATTAGGTCSISGLGVGTPRVVMTGSSAGNRTGITLTPPA